MTYKTEIEKAIVDHFMSQEMVDFYDIIKTSRMPNMWMGYLDDADHVDMAVGVVNNQLHILASETVSERKPIASVFPLNRFERTVTKEMDADEDAIRVDFSGDVPFCIFVHFVSTSYIYSNRNWGMGRCPIRAFRVYERSKAKKKERFRRNL